MLEFIEEIKQVHPGIFVHSILIEEELEADQRASWVCALGSLEQPGT
jgi:palmitoyl-protein thioesterase